MSRSLDLLLLALVLGLGWWLFFAREHASHAAALAAEARARSVASAALVQSAAAERREPIQAPSASGPSSEAVQDEGIRATEAPAPTAPGTLRWRVDDRALLEHRQLALVVETDEGRRTLDWSIAEDELDEVAAQPGPSGDGVVVVTEPLAPGVVAIGVALRLPAVDVLRWWPGVQVPAGSQGTLPGGEMQLRELLDRVRLDVVDAAGAPVSEFTVRWPVPEWEHSWSIDPYLLLEDDDGAILLPRRPGVRVRVRAGDARAEVEDPADGARVVVR